MTDLIFARDALTERTHASSARFRKVFLNDRNPNQQELPLDSQSSLRHARGILKLTKDATRR